ncbi:hypothetical protein KBD34_01850 [Patescibacteria group bacterium]|nr:hypothetical protein [Patescibacteria group bacterium]
MVADPQFDPQAVKEHGLPYRNINPPIAPIVAGDQMLIMLLSDGVSEIAVDVSEKRSYDYWYGRYCAGDYVSMKLRTLSKASKEQCKLQP